MSNCAAQKSNSSIESPEYGPAFINTRGEELTATPKGYCSKKHSNTHIRILSDGRSTLESMFFETPINDE